jgi:molybdopterin-guanine dinucleotide biosynthesis protein MobB
MHELRGENEPSLEALLRQLAPVDLVIAEGFKRAAIPKLEIHRADLGKPLLAPEDANIVAVASDLPVAGIGALPRFALDDVGAIAAFIIRHLGLAVRSGGPAQ